jgi:hypothetical protein
MHDIQQVIVWNAVVHVARKVHRIDLRMGCTVRTAVCSGGMGGTPNVKFVLLCMVVAWRDAKRTVRTAVCSDGMEGH